MAVAAETVLVDFFVPEEHDKSINIQLAVRRRVAVGNDGHGKVGAFLNGPEGGVGNGSSHHGAGASQKNWVQNGREVVDTHLKIKEFALHSRSGAWPQCLSPVQDAMGLGVGSVGVAVAVSMDGK